MADIVVTRYAVHGMPVDQYVTALRERLPEWDIAVAETPESERDLIADATVLTGNDVSPELVDTADSLQLFAGTYAGYDHLPLLELADRDIALTTASGVHGPNVAENV